MEETDPILPEEEEILVYEGDIEELAARSKQFARGAAGDLKRVALMGRIGKYWLNVRSEAGLTRRKVIDTLANISMVDFVGFEAGVVDYQDLPSDFLPRLAKVLERPDALERFRIEFPGLSP